MSKFPINTKAGLVRRKSNTAQFNPANGEPHTAKFLSQERESGLRRKRTRVVK